MKKFLRSSPGTSALVLVITLVAASFVEEEWAQVQAGSQGQSACLNQLIPCLNYLNGRAGGEPSDSCCNPLKSVIKSVPQCLCSMISNKGTEAAESAGINVTEAQELPGRCGLHVDPISSCLAPTSSAAAAGTANSGNSVSLTYIHMLQQLPVIMASAAMLV